VFFSVTNRLLTFRKANVLVSNDTPPRACLSGFGFITAVLDPNQNLSCSAQVLGGTITFMSPELLVPEMYDLRTPKVTPQADIYAFGMVIYQVRQRGCRCLSC